MVAWQQITRVSLILHSSVMSALRSEFLSRILRSTVREDGVTLTLLGLSLVFCFELRHGRYCGA